jgi:pyruvate dehydrogenase E1 component alpha subunit/2-oxoisovalerate dehydrogenase E1 component alpha subunit
MASLTREQMLEMYRSMCLTRALEERLERLFKQGHIVGGLYRSLGQEATAVGSAYALEPEDWLAPSIRDMGALLVRGLAPVDMFRQYTARRDAPTGGKDNTNHFTIPELGILGPVSPLGTQLAVLNGVALSFRIRGESRVCMTYQGEGATRTGTSHEGLNFAAVQRLPMVVVLEHNRWAFSTRSDREAAVGAWTDVAGAYGLPVRQVDGNDVLEVYDAAREAVDRARRGEGASLIVAETYRMLGHAQHDPQPYVDPAELEAWRERDPIDCFGRYVIENGLATDEGLAAMRREIESEVAAAADEAVAGPRPDPEEARTRAYAAEPADGGVPWTRREVVGYADAPSGVAPARPFGSGAPGESSGGSGTAVPQGDAAATDGKQRAGGA